MFKECPVLDESCDGCTTGQVDCEQTPKGNNIWLEGLKMSPDVYRVEQKVEALGARPIKNCFNNRWNFLMCPGETSDTYLSLTKNL
jgi:hypothetical protein